MPLINIWNFDRTIKKMIQASSLHALIEQGAIKLGYSNQSNLKVLIKSNGTDVDSEEIFSALISENMFPATVLMLLSHEHILSDSSTNLSASFIPFSLPASSSQSEPPAEAAPVFDCTVSPVFTIPYMDFPKKLKADCDRSKMPEKSLILKMIRVVATSLDEIRMKRQNDRLMHPSICILGNSLLHNSKGYLLVESVLLGDLANVVDLIPILFASYYVFNLCYPPGAEATLEFLQREFLKINPPGHKRGGKKKRTTVHPKVSTLLVNLQHHISQWGHEDDSDIYASD